MILSLYDIFFQFTILFAAGILVLTIFLPIKHVGEKFFATQVWFAIGCLLLGIVGCLYQFLSQDRALPSYLYLYLLVLFCSGLFIYFLNKHQIFLSKLMLYVQVLVVLVGLYFHAADLSQSRIGLEDPSFFIQFVSSAFLLGSVFTAMMLCHWFFMFHKLPIKYLKRISHIFTVSLILKVLITGVVIWLWRFHFIEDYTRLVSWGGDFIFLFARFGFGLFLPLFLAFGTEVTIKLPSNHAAIGILYVAVIFIFIGEVLGQYLTLIRHIPL